jgi:hypothetical protein
MKFFHRAPGSARWNHIGPISMKSLHPIQKFIRIPSRFFKEWDESSANMATSVPLQPGRCERTSYRRPSRSAVVYNFHTCRSRRLGDVSAGRPVPASRQATELCMDAGMLSPPMPGMGLRRRQDPTDDCASGQCTRLYRRPSTAVRWRQVCTQSGALPFPGKRWTKG